MKNSLNNNAKSGNVLRFMVALCLLGPGLVHACTASVSPGSSVNLGSHPSTVALSPGTLAPVSGPVQVIFTLDCPGAVLTLASNPSVKATLSATGSGTNPPQLKKAGEVLSIPYELASSANSGATLYTVGTVLYNQSGALLSLFSGSIINIPIYFRASLLQNLSAGDYQDTVSVTWQPNNICQGLLGLLGICLGTVDNTAKTTLITVTVHIERACTINAPDINFGSAILPSQFGSVVAQAQILCTKGLAYTVGFTAGAHASGGKRRMQHGSSDYLSYDIFKADTTLWSSTDRVAGGAVGNGVSPQTMPFTAAIYPAQATPATGSYTDNLIIDVGF